MTRTVDARVDVLRGGVKLTELSWVADDPPDIRAYESSTIKASMAGVFKPNDAIDWVTDELRPVLITDGIETPLGIYRAGTVTDSISAGGRMVQIEAYDRCWLCQSRKTESVLHFAAGSGYLGTIEGLLTACGIALIITSPSDAVLSTDREDWDIGTDYLTIINTLLGEINFDALWFDCRGYARLQAHRTPDAAGIDHIYRANDPTVQMRREYDRTTDVFGRPNVIVAVCDNPDLDAPLVAKSENNSPQSELSIMRRGMRVTQLVKVDNIASQTQLQAYADQLIFDNMLAGETINLTTALESEHGMGDTVGLIRPEQMGLYREVGWEMQLKAGGEMAHMLQRVICV